MCASLIALCTLGITVEKWGIKGELAMFTVVMVRGQKIEKTGDPDAQVIKLIIQRITGA